MSSLRSSLTSLLLVTTATRGLAAPPTPTVLQIPNPVAAQGAMFGTAVAGIGDVNGDGVGDLVVSSLGAAKVFIISGANRTVLHTITDPDGLSDVRFGAAVAGVGDLDGDGVEDIAVGSPGDDLTILLPCLGPDPCPPQPFQGRAFIFSGASGALVRRLLPAGSEFLAFGFSIASLGDVNGDGKPDIAVGAPTRRNNRFGQVFLFSGADGSQLWKSVEPSTQALASYGQFLAAIDDVNGDGRRDLLVDAPFHDYDPTPGFLLAGQAYAISGATGAILRTHDNPSPADGDAFGAGLTGLGDEDGDGVEEYALGDPAAGTVWVFRGSNGALLRSIVSPGNAATDFFGFPLVRVEDRDGDGIDDFWTAASRAGKLYLTSATGASIQSVSDPTPGAPEPNGGFGRSLAATADLGGDGLDDLLVGEPAEPVPGPDAGAAFVVVNDRPPVAKCQPIIRSADPTCSATVAASEIDAGSFDPDGDALSFTLAPPGPYPLGATTVVLTVSDGRGASATCASTVTVIDTTPPVITSAAADPAVLWPPNHRMVDVPVRYVVADNCTPAGALACGLAATSSEPADGRGDGHTAVDIAVVDAGHVLLRAERSGRGPGRVYTVAITCTDEATNATSVAVSVDVLHSLP